MHKFALHFFIFFLPLRSRDVIFLVFKQLHIFLTEKLLFLFEASEECLVKVGIVVIEEFEWINNLIFALDSNTLGRIANPPQQPPQTPIYTNNRLTILP